MTPPRDKITTTVKAGQQPSLVATPSATVAVYQKKNGGFFVAPPVVVIRAGETLRVINATDVHLTVTIPLNGTNPGTKPVTTPVIKSIDAHSDGVVPIPSLGPPFTAFSYSVLVGSTPGTPAFGNSDPVIIIDR